MSKDAAHPDKNRHHTDPIRSQADFLEQFAPDMTSEPDVFTKEEIDEMNRRLHRKMQEPIDYTGETF